MSNKYLKTDEREEVISNLEMLADTLSKIKEDLYNWKWAILSLHSSLQGFMVLALRGGNGLNCLRDKIKKEWLKAYNENTPLPDEKLDSFLNLYNKIQKSDSMKFTIKSRIYVPKGNEKWSVKKLNSLRNEFIHFVPKGWLLEISGLPNIFNDCINIIDFLFKESGNIDWYKMELEKRVKNSINDIRNKLDNIENV